MNILIVGGHQNQGLENDMEAYVSLFTKTSGSKVEYCFLDQLQFWVTPDHFQVKNIRSGRELNDYDMVIFRGKIAAYTDNAFFASRYLEEVGIPHMNDYKLYRSRSKLAQAITFRELKLPFVPTLYGEDPEALAVASSERFTFPVIVKDSLGSHGELNFLAKSNDELREILSKHSDRNFVVQPYVPNNCDYRILVAGDDELIIKRTANSDSHLNNTSQGGSAELIDPKDFPPEIIRQSHVLTKALNMTLCGVDVMENSKTHEMVFLEANSQPQLVTGAFMEEKARLLKKFFDSKA